jgi:phage terminase large subunit-like protein
MVPKADIIKTSAARGTADAVETMLVKHPLGQSQLTFKSYSDGREKWQGETLDFVWFDEEPPQDIYTEGLTRTNATGGMVMITETPLLGMSEVVRQFLGTNGISRSVVTMEIDDVGHYSEEQKAQIVAAYPEHEREARAKGIPFLGSGRIFPVEESLIVVEPFQIPKHWFQLIGMDFGYDPHPAAVIWLAVDRDAQTIYVVDEYRRSKAVIAEVASAAKKRGPLPVAWPHDGFIKDKSSGEQVAQLFRNEGLNMISEHAQFPDERKMGVEAGVLEMLNKMVTGRWKVFSTCQMWLEEFRLYHRKDGQIVKEYDDLLCASRYGMMMQRYGLQVESLPKKPERYRKKPKYTSWMAA